MNRLRDIPATDSGNRRRQTCSTPACRHTQDQKWLPSSLVKQCVVYGAGEFLDTSLPASKEKEEEIFGEMLEHLTQEASRTCILIEFRNLDNSMFGYRFFRKNDFFRSTGCVSVTLCIVRRKRKTVSARHVSVRSGKDSKTEPK